MADSSDPVQYWIDAASAAAQAQDPSTQTSPATVPTNAIQSSAPVTGGGGSWSDFWHSATAGALNYVIKRDAVKSGVALPAGVQPGTPYVVGGQAMGQSGISPTLLVLGAVVVVAVIAMRR